MQEEQELEKKEAGAEPWMLTYGDMVTLLLTFFVLLFAFATIDVQKFREVVISLKGTLGVLSGGERVFLPGDLPKPDPQSGQPVAAQDLAQPVPTESERQGLEGEKSDVNTYQTGQGEVVALPNIVFFKKGEAKLSDAGKVYLDRLLPLISYYKDNEISIIGHTDPDPPSPDSPFKSNWDLASARARAVIDHYDKKGIPANRFSLTAYAEHKQVRHASGDVKEDSKQRRIDIIFRKKFSPNPLDTIQISGE